MRLYGDERPSKGITLETVKLALNEWRQQRVKGSRIPKELWQDIKSLTTPLNYEGLAATLKIPPQRLCKAAGFAPDVKEGTRPKAPISFAEVSLAPLEENPLDLKNTGPSQRAPFRPQSFLEITRPNGTLVKVQGLETKSLVTLLQHLA